MIQEESSLYGIFWFAYVEDALISSAFCFCNMDVTDFLSLETSD